MNKAELVTSMAEASNLTKKDTEAALNAFMKVVQDTLASGDKVQLVGFGTFEVRDKVETQETQKKLFKFQLQKHLYLKQVNL